VIELSSNLSPGRYDFVLSSGSPKIVRSVLKVRTTKLRDVVDLTDKVKDFVEGSGVKDGIMLCYNKHTTSALILANRREGVVELISEVLSSLLEEKVEEKSRGEVRDPEIARAYVSSAIFGASVEIPIESGKCTFGDWQGLYLLETFGPRDREVILTAIGS